MRDQIVDFVRRWSEKTEISAGRFISGSASRPASSIPGARRYGCVNEHNGWVPRDFWLQEWEKAGHSRLLSRASAARLPAADVHDARRRHRGRQPVERLAGVEPGGPAAQVERQNVAERNGLPTASGTASALAYRCFLHQHLGHVLLPLQRARRLQPFDCALGLARGDEGSRCRDHSRSRQGEISAVPNRASSPTTGRSLSPRTSRNSSVSSGMTHVRTSP